MPETIWTNQDVSSNIDKNEYNPDDLERIESDRLIMKKVLLDAKIAEAKDFIRSELDDFNTKIRWMTPE